MPFKDPEKQRASARRYGKSELGKVTQRKKLLTFKKRVRDYLGGKCSRCGYNKCDNALDVHHRDPSKKTMTIGGKIRKFETVQAELDECILLCANCHREIHALEDRQCRS